MNNLAGNASTAPIPGFTAQETLGRNLFMDVTRGNCQACHNYGVAGAPKTGDVAAWADRLTKGIETVYANAINGIGGMPAKGTCMDCSDDEIIATIDYMLENSQ